MVTVIGVDPHKATHVASAVDANGKFLKTCQVKARDTSHAELLAWARSEFDGDRLWAVEDERNMAGRLLRDLLAAGERVVTVPAYLAAETRRTGRLRGKSDKIDGIAVARTALRERLEEFTLDPVSRDVKSLSDHRTTLVNERTRAQNRLRDLLHQHDPDLAAAIPRGGLTRTRWLTTIQDQFPHDTSVTSLILTNLIQSCRQLTTMIKAVEKRLNALLAEVAQPLLNNPGCAEITAAVIIGEVAGVRRFRTEAALAAYAGIAPLEASSGRNQHHRINRRGNRRLNWAIHIIAVTQLRTYQPARDYYQRRITNGSTPKVAMRALKRLIIRKIYGLLRHPALTTQTT
jgi:transposase